MSMKNFMPKSKWRVRKQQRGIVVIEAVIILPVVLFLILAVAELCNAMLQYNVLTRAVRDSARYAANVAEAGAGVQITLNATKISATQNLAAYGTTGAGTAILPGLTPANITVSVLNNQDILVAAQYPYQPLFAGNIPALVGDGTAGGSIIGSVLIGIPTNASAKSLK